MKQKMNSFAPILRVLFCIVASVLFIKLCNAGELSESETFFSFIEALDPENVLNFDKNMLLASPCLHNWKGVVCSFGASTTTITEIWLEKMNLSGIIDTDSLCKLPNMRVVSLANNHIHGRVSQSISQCKNLTYLNLSNNFLCGDLPVNALNKLKRLKRLDVSDNLFSYGNVKHARKKYKIRKILSELLKENGKNEAEEEAVHVMAPMSEGSPSSYNIQEHHKASKSLIKKLCNWLPLVFGISFFVLSVSYVSKRAAQDAKDRDILKSLAESPADPFKFPPIKDVGEVKPLQEHGEELFFFAEEEDSFKMADLLEAQADLQGQGLCSSLYKVQLKNNAIFAVKRLKHSPVSFEQFCVTMSKIGKMMHPNILPLVGYGFTGNETKLLIYKFQKNGSLLSALENYTEGKSAFPWKTRLSIATGIARGLDFIYQEHHDGEIIPHGNIKLSNIMLSENDTPLISEYGYTKFLDPKKACLFNANGYLAPEESLSEQSDVFSFGVILLELLTGKIVEKSGVDLPKWVKAMVREEWTGEVFDKEIAKVGQYAFPLLNISLKCVSLVPEDRPSIAEVLEKIEGVANIQEDLSPTSTSSVESTPLGLLHTVPEDWDTPGSYP